MDGFSLGSEEPFFSQKKGGSGTGRKRCEAGGGSRFLDPPPAKFPWEGGI
jgi:hypothetical protein